MSTPVRRLASLPETLPAGVAYRRAMAATQTARQRFRDRWAARIRTGLQVLYGTGATILLGWAADRFGIVVDDIDSTRWILALVAGTAPVVTAGIMTGVDRLTARWPWLQFIYVVPDLPVYGRPVDGQGDAIEVTAVDPD